MQSASFTASDAEIANPERGFFRWTWGYFEALTADDMQDAYDKGYRLVYAPVDLSAYRSTDLSASLLSKLEASLAIVRARGMKIVLRMAYNYPANETDYLNAQDATLAQVLRHINQLKPLLQNNSDVIAYYQAGFIGAWGEWHTSSNNLTSTSNRTQVRDALLDAVPTSRFIQVRYPPYIMSWAPTLPSLDNVLQGGYRIGAHNDCFLASTTDVGTFDENATTRATQRAYTDALGDLAPYGGETCNPVDEPVPTPRSSCADILAEGARYNLVYLNDDYYRSLFHDKWVTDGCMPQVKRSMGYRLQLVSVSHVDSAVRGQSLSLALSIRNVGWSRIFNPRGVQILLRNRSTAAVRRLDATGADPRRWLPGQTSSASLSITIPTDLAAGSYDVLFALPDAAASLANDVRYAIRPGNADNSGQSQQWQPTLGAFQMGTTLLVR